jgi:hypothetical protein
MARIRTVKPEFWGNAQVTRCSRDARLLFLALLNESDDEGRQLASPRRITGFAFPNDRDVSPKMVEKWLDELESASLIAKYRAEGVEYLVIPGFTRNQRISRPSPSRLPSPPASLLALTEPSLSPRGVTSGSLGADLGSGSRNKDLGSAGSDSVANLDSVAPTWVRLGMSRADWKDAGKPEVESA